MKEVFLYRCDTCGAVKCIEGDKGRIFYEDCCGSCKGWSYYEKIVSNNKYDMFCNYVETCFVLEEKKDDSKEEKDTRI